MPKDLSGPQHREGLVLDHTLGLPVEESDLARNDDEDVGRGLAGFEEHSIFGKASGLTAQQYSLDLVLVGLLEDPDGVQKVDLLLQLLVLEVAGKCLIEDLQLEL